jgi:hypothetical protein
VSDNNVIEQGLYKRTESFHFLLKKDLWYAVKIIKSGCHSKLISIDTHLPNHQYEQYIFKLSFIFDEPLATLESAQLDQDAMDFPIAVFNFNLKQGEFDFDEHYAKNIKKILMSPLSGIYYEILSIPEIKLK